MLFKKGQIPWNKGIKWSDEIKSRISDTLKDKGIKPSVIYVANGRNNFAWKGNKVGYSGLHRYMRKQLGKPTYCANNIKHESKRFVWANISGNYTRDINDWHSLCNSCNLKDGVSVKNKFDDKFRRIATL